MDENKAMNQDNQAMPKQEQQAAGDSMPKQAPMQDGPKSGQQANPGNDQNRQARDAQDDEIYEVDVVEVDQFFL